MDYNRIIEIVKEAGKIVFDESLISNISIKGDFDFVTAVDTAISDFIKKELKIVTPDIGFMSEEESCEIVPTRWILDPIDGTTNLIHNYSMSSISLALCENEKITFGIVFNPFNGELFEAYLGKGAFCNGKKLESIENREFKNCLIEFGAGSTRKNQADEVFNIAKEVFLNCLDLRRVCSSALVNSHIAAGRLDGYFEKHLKPWDYAAASLILSECGGVCKTWDNENVPFDRPCSFVSGSPKTVETLLNIINKYNNK